MMFRFFGRVVMNDRSETGNKFTAVKMLSCSSTRLLRRRRPRNGTIPSLVILLSLHLAHFFTLANGCQFYPVGEYLRFVRIPENLRVGERVLAVEVQNRQNLTLESVEKGEDAKFFRIRDLSERMVEIQLAKSLENLVEDHKSPQNILKFRLVCFPEDADTAPSFLSITVYVEDCNNNAPKFVHAPYHITVDELTPIGLTIFRGISAIDLDKPNTPNSDINYSIVSGNAAGKFGLESSQRPSLLIKKSLDYDAGDHEFQLVIMASDRGSPPLSANATAFVSVKDNDDLPVAFRKPIYRTQIKEFYPVTNETIRQEMKFSSPILAHDQDLSINTSVTYDIVSGNELNYFEIDSSTGKLYLTHQVDREALPSDIFDLQIRARQIDNPNKFGLAKVVVEILDLNDNFPVFDNLSYNISIMENLPNGFSVLMVTAEDLDQGDNAEFVYKLEDRTKAFMIDPKSGWLTVRDETKLDREKVESIELKVFTEEKLLNIANGGKKSQALVTIGLLDANDNSPVFSPSNLFHFQVTIDSEIGSVVGQVTAEDLDVESNGNGKVIYEIQKSNNSNEEIPFEIDSKNGYIFLLERPLPKLQYTILVEASDQPSNPSERRYSLAVVQIDVVKAGATHSPEFVGSPYEFWVGTQVGIGTSVGQVKVKDLDPKHTVYDLLHSYYEGVPFAIEERTGIIAVVDELIKYPRHHYDFEAYVTDSRHTLTTNVSIHVVDPVDVITASSREPIELSVKENVGGAILANLRKLLREPTRDTRGMEFLLANYDARDKFAIANDGTVYTLKGLNREEKDKYLLTVISQSRGVIQGQGVYQIVVNVLDENDSKPQFDRLSYEGHVRENSNPGTTVLMEHPVRVVDLDAGQNAQFRIELKGEGSNRFRIDPLTGKIYVGNHPLDREEKQLYSLELVATDTGNLSSSVPIRITVEDINDNAPTFGNSIVLDPPELDQSINGPRELLRASASQPVSVEISNTEPIRIPETVEVGTKIARVLASDRDLSENAIVFYRIVSENSNSVGDKFTYLTDKQYLFSRNKDKHFIIDRTLGEISVAKPLKPDTEYALNISASDRGGLRSYTGVKVVVYDVNNFQPVFQKTWYSFEVLEGHYVRGGIGKVSAQDGDSGINGHITYSLQPKDGVGGEKFPFSIDSKTGDIYASGDIDRETQDKYLLTASATDSGDPPMEGVVDVQVEIMDKNDNRPMFYAYMNTVRGSDDQLIPIYRTSVFDNVPIGTVVTSVFANDTDYVGNGNGLVLLHLSNHHSQFYIDSKNGTISTVGKLDYDQQNEYNLTVIASDLGKPSLSSTAWVFVRVLKAAPTVDNVVPERMFEKEIYIYQVPYHSPVPSRLTQFNVTNRFKKHRNEFELFGEESVISKFRLDPMTGELYIMKALEEGRVYEFLIRGHTQRHSRGFDTRQGGQISNTYLGLNEALVRVRRMPIPIPPTPVPPIKKRPLTTLGPRLGPEPAIITKAPPKIVFGKSANGNRHIAHNISDSLPADNNNIHSYQKTANFYAGEIAVLTLSSVIFLGGLVAAISVACVRRKRRSRRRMTRHVPAIPVEVRLQKQLPTARIANGPSRPILFPMALPGDPMMGEANSENTSDTYTESGEGHKDSYALQSAGFSICPDCRKLRKPGRVSSGQHAGHGHGGGRDTRDRGPMKLLRPLGPREISLQSSNDSGIDGSDGHCNCCHSHNSSSDSGREQFEDSLMPQHHISQHNKPKSFRRKQRLSQRQFSNGNRTNDLNYNPNAFRSDRVVIL